MRSCSPEVQRRRAALRARSRPLMSYSSDVPTLEPVRSPLLIGSLSRSSGREESFEALAERSERLAEEHAPHAPSQFDELVAEAADRLPEELQRQLEGLAVVVSDDGAEARAYGLYWGDTVARDDAPDCLVIFQDTLERDFGHDQELLARQVELTLRHELAHRLGWDEAEVETLGL